MATKVDLVQTLEAHVDQTSLLDVLVALGSMCHEKAEHMRVNWQDYSTAKAWESAARAVEKAAQKASDLSL